MKCNCCGKGKGRKNRTTGILDDNPIIFYYYCQDCIGQIGIELTPKEKKKLIEEFIKSISWFDKSELRDYWRKSEKERNQQQWEMLKEVGGKEE